jgi:hypothetical protein
MACQGQKDAVCLTESTAGKRRTTLSGMARKRDGADVVRLAVVRALGAHCRQQDRG